VVRKYRVRPTLASILSGVQASSLQGLGRATTSLEVQSPHDAPEGISDIPSRNLLEDLDTLDEELDAARQRLTDAEEALETSTGDFTEQFEAHETAIAAAQERLDAAEQELTDLDTDITAAATAATNAWNAAQTATNTANTAKDDADAAGASALEALNKANDASDRASTADGRYTVATANPTTADAIGKPLGAVWEVRSGSITQRRYVLTGATTWTQVKVGQDFIGDKAIGRAQMGDAAIGTAQIGDLAVTNGKIGDLDVGKLTASGTSKFQAAVISTLLADDAFLTRLYAERVVIAAQPVNLIDNGAGELGSKGGWAAHPSLTWQTTDVAAGEAGAFTTAAGMGSMATTDTLKPVDGGQLLFEVWLKADKPGSRIVFELRNQAAAHGTGSNTVLPGATSENVSTGSYPLVVNPVPTEWTKYQIVINPLSTTTHLRLGTTYFNHSAGTERQAVISVAGLRLRPRTQGELIVDGSIKARHVAAQEVAAAVGVFVDAMMTNLTSTGVANLNVAAINQVWARLAVVDRLQALTSIITRDMLATGSVTAEKITASQAFFDKLVTSEFAAGKLGVEMFQLGENARWTEQGLVFYAPVVPGQQVDDWANRQPIIVISPNGDVSIAVAQDGEVTAGMQSTGDVWGGFGSFDELEVGGVPFIDHQGPRGPMSAVTLSENTTLSTTERILIRDKFSPLPDRLYRFTARLSLGGNNAGYFGIKSSGSTVSMNNTSVVNEGFGATGSDTEGKLLIAYVPGSYFTPNADGETEIGYTGRVKSGTTPLYAGSGTTDALSGTYFLIEDAGPDIPLDVATATTPANTTPAPPTKKQYTKTYTASGVRGYRASGSQAGDPRILIAGSAFGAAMSERLVFSMPDAFYSDLQGATIKSAKITVRCTQVYSSKTNISFYVGVTPTNGLPATMPSFTNTNEGAITNGQTKTYTVPSGYFAAIISARGLTVTPKYAGSLSSYGYFDKGATKITVTYTK
jgi:hypothetical protein